MRTVELTIVEKEVLRNHKKQSPHILARAKAEAVLLYAQGAEVEFIAEFEEREPRTVSGWIKDWCERGFASVVTGHANNLNASKLTGEQRDDVRKRLSQSPKDENGLPAGFWDVPKLAH
jgi:transposase